MPQTAGAASAGWPTTAGATKPRKVVVIGAGIAGLCTAVYARKCGYEVEVLERHETAGGLATSWRRGDYTFETCLHWLLGSNPGSAFHSQWREVCDVDRLSFLDPEEYVRIESAQGDSLSVFADPTRMEAELLRHAPQDGAEIRKLASAVRAFAHLELPDPTLAPPARWRAMLKALPMLPSIRHWSRMTIEQYGRRFRHPLLRQFFLGSENARLSALALVFTLAWMGGRNAAYPIGGSQAVVRLVVEKLARLGGKLRLGTPVRRIVVEQGAATGVQLVDGETVGADWVISAADGHHTIYELLDGRYVDRDIDRTYATLPTFPSYVQVSLGVALDLSGQARFVTNLLDEPLVVDPDTRLAQFSTRFFHFDPSFAPPGKTAVTCFLPTRNYAFWVARRQQDPAQYRAEKARVAEAVIALLEKRIPGLRQAVEVIDVSTPATVIGTTGNWKGSMEGWLLTPQTGFRPLRKTLPGLKRFMMVGQWVMPGGGLPSGLMTARSAVRDISRADGLRFAAT